MCQGRDLAFRPILPSLAVTLGHPLPLFPKSHGEGSVAKHQDRWLWRQTGGIKSPLGCSLLVGPWASHFSPSLSPICAVGRAGRIHRRLGVRPSAAPGV